MLTEKKKIYIKPDIKRISLDYTVSLRMLTNPSDPPPRSGGKGTSPRKDDPFASPFGDKPFG
jgi:hypothetical protein